jgi:hypothetical protein
MKAQRKERSHKRPAQARTDMDGSKLVVALKFLPVDQGTTVDQVSVERTVASMQAKARVIWIVRNSNYKKIRDKKKSGEMVVV